jgi:hypothetical protein
MIGLPFIMKHLLMLPLTDYIVAATQAIDLTVFSGQTKTHNYSPRFSGK